MEWGMIMALPTVIGMLVLNLARPGNRTKPSGVQRLMNPNGRSFHGKGTGAGIPKSSLIFNRAGDAFGASPASPSTACSSAFSKTCLPVLLYP